MYTIVALVDVETDGTKCSVVTSDVATVSNPEDFINSNVLTRRPCF